MIHHHSFWEFRDCISEVAKLADMVRKVVQEMHLYKVEIGYFNELLCNCLLNLHIIFIRATTLSRYRKIVPSWVNCRCLLLASGQLLFKGYRDLLCRFTGAESTENILVTMKLLQIVLHVLDCSFSIVQVLCHEVKIH